MCLVSALSQPIKAEEDIRVWKILTLDGGSPYRWGFTYTKGKNEPKATFSSAGDIIYGTVYPVLYNYGEGWLHAYTTMFQGLKSMAMGIPWVTEEDKLSEVMLVGMVIPKGTPIVTNDENWRENLLHNPEVCTKTLEWPEDAVVWRVEPRDQLGLFWFRFYQVSGPRVANPDFTCDLFDGQFKSIIEGIENRLPIDDCL